MRERRVPAVSSLDVPQKPPTIGSTMFENTAELADEKEGNPSQHTLISGENRRLLYVGLQTARDNPWADSTVGSFLSCYGL